MDYFWLLLFLICTPAATAICAYLAPRLRWWWNALFGASLGLAMYWGIVVAVTGHLDKFFFLAIIPQALLSIGLSALTAFVVSGLKK
jgi:hypothetical protein